MDIFNNFPHPEFRVHQKETIAKIEDAFNRGIHDVILEAPTGAGKSAVALTMGLHTGSAYLLTPQKILQEQYMRDYASNGMALLKGRSNYPCLYYGAGFNCKEGCEKLSISCPDKHRCIYDLAKKNALASPVALMNYSYFLSALEHTNIIQPRKLIIFDECHSLEAECMKLIEFSFSDFTLSKLGITSKIPEYSETHEYLYWVQDILDTVERLIVEDEAKLPANQDMELPFDFEMASSGIGSSGNDEMQKLRTELEALKTLKTKIQRFIITFGKVEWISDMARNATTKRNVLTFKPLQIKAFTDKYIFNVSEYRIYMSATPGGKSFLCNILGIQPDVCEYIKVPSTFPKENMPIYCTTSGKMDMNSLNETLPKIVEDVDKILEFHDGQKGIIHSHTFKISDYILTNSKYSDRLMTHSSGTREEQLKAFMETTEPKVLISPSMTDGLDLKDDLARFVVIVKIPYLFLGDKQIKRRMEVDPEWYRCKAAITLVQAAGRGMRHDKDSCTIYIMDSSIRWFIKQNREYFPKHFIDSIQN